MPDDEEKSHLGEWSKREAKIAEKCADELFEAIPKSRRLGHIGTLNELMVFLAEAGKHAPEVK